MFRNVLVGIDGSANATAALAQAIEIARASRSRLGLLGVAPSPSLAARMAMPPFALRITPRRLAAELRRDAQRHVDDAERTVPADVPVTKLLAVGSMARALLDHTREGGWDLVVVGPRSLTDRSLRATRVPVLIVPPACERPPAPRCFSGSAGRRRDRPRSVLRARPLA